MWEPGLFCLAGFVPRVTYRIVLTFCVLVCNPGNILSTPKSGSLVEPSELHKTPNKGRSMRDSPCVAAEQPILEQRSHLFRSELRL